MGPVTICMIDGVRYYDKRMEWKVDAILLNLEFTKFKIVFRSDFRDMKTSIYVLSK